MQHHHMPTFPSLDILEDEWVATWGVGEYLRQA